MKKTPVLWNTPLIQATCYMIAGIFIADTCYECTYLYYALIGVYLCGIICSSFLYKCHTEWRAIGLACIFLLIGSANVYRGHTERQFPIIDSAGCYDVQLISPPVYTGKNLRATAILLQHHPTPSLQGIHHINGGYRKKLQLTFAIDTCHHSTLKIGQVLRIYTQIHPTAVNRRIEGWDYESYLYRKGIVGTAFIPARHYKKIPLKTVENPTLTALKIRETLSTRIASWGMTKEATAVVSALTIGDKSELSPELNEAYSTAGISHILALSGLHVGILAGMLWVLFYPLRQRVWGRYVTGIALVLLLGGYAFITGMSASVIRAVCMCLFLQLYSLFSKRKISPIPLVGVVAFFMLLWEPMYIFDIGFQLSFVAVTGLILIVPHFSAFAPRSYIMSHIYQVLIASTVAQCSLLPFILYHFGTFPTYFLLGNLLMAPMVLVIICLSVLILLLPIPPIHYYLCRILEKLIMYLNECITTITHWQGAKWEALYISGWEAILCGLVLICIIAYLRKPHFYRCKWLLCSCILCIGTMLYHKVQTPTLYWEIGRGKVAIIEKHRRIFLSPQADIYSYHRLHCALFRNTQWQYKSSTKKLPLQYAYIRRGFRGKIQYLQTLFAIQEVVLDTSLPPTQLHSLKKECESLGLPFLLLRPEEKAYLPLKR